MRQVSNDDLLGQLSNYIADAEKCLCPKIDMGGLYSRNNTAHKWKVTLRTIVLRELVSWRFFDLLEQVVELEKMKHLLGLRILLRSSIETLALLVYSNQKMENIIRTGDGFHEYSKKTVNLLVGSGNEYTEHKSVNVLDVLKKCKSQYPEILRAYDDLSETVHPNWDSLMRVYSKVDKKEFITYFDNHVEEQFGSSQLALIKLLLGIFDEEYNERWCENFGKFEAWIELNDEKLEASK